MEVLLTQNPKGDVLLKINKINSFDVMLNLMKNPHTNATESEKIPHTTPARPERRFVNGQMQLDKIRTFIQ